ncbi:DNA-directed RNA polymerase subunit alpha [Entomobacter blattae]|uniref:DNA-directed RNA polymerase subunit alpha n=1 Tax=Entomobacter blattae TaxID=2762277 RepID=A0A7H1NR27_9PROT|nr:DNA-directed RNA polymerase subunit alpha [Entomobacter blattae]
MGARRRKSQNCRDKPETAVGPGEVKASQIQAGHDIEVMNPDLVICTLDKGATLGMELTVNIGKRSMPAVAGPRMLLLVLFQYKDGQLKPKTLPPRRRNPLRNACP